MKVIEGIYLLLGSNLGNRAENLQNAQKYLGEQAGSIVAASSIYETEAWGFSDQPLFYNQVLQIDTQLGHEALLKVLLAIEKKIGKVKVGKWRERLIDIDLLYYDNRLVRTPQLTLPHPEIQNRRFTLAPLVELIPDEMHPMLLRTQRQLLESTPDQLEVWKAEEQGVRGEGLRAER
ncbi:MAG: 2-amino-4-hydroxy-6-hydroxymethyldihydropteridine diphosphokinase [Cyclobacteriaceae bacterium]